MTECVEILGKKLANVLAFQSKDIKQWLLDYGSVPGCRYIYMIIIFVFIIAGNARGRQGKYDSNGCLLCSWPGSSTNDSLWCFLLWFLLICFFEPCSLTCLKVLLMFSWYIYIDYFGLKCIFVLSLSVIEYKSIIMK